MGAGVLGTNTPVEMLLRPGLDQVNLQLGTPRELLLWYAPKPIKNGVTLPEWDLGQVIH